MYFPLAETRPSVWSLKEPLLCSFAKRSCFSSPAQKSLSSPFLSLGYKPHHVSSCTMGFLTPDAVLLAVMLADLHCWICLTQSHGILSPLSHIPPPSYCQDIWPVSSLVFPPTLTNLSLSLLLDLFFKTCINKDNNPERRPQFPW